MCACKTFVKSLNRFLLLILQKSSIFAIDFKNNKNEKSNCYTNLRGALFICPTLSRAKPYDLSYCLVSKLQDRPRGSKSVKRPLVVDLTGRILTVPSQVEGYTLILESEEGVVYTYYIIGTSMELPQELSGNYQITISDGNIMYHGTIEF